MTGQKEIGILQDFWKMHRGKIGTRTLLVGSKLYKNSVSRRHWYSDCVGLDFQEGDEVDIVHDLEQPLPKELGLFDHIDCCSVLEHVRQPWLAGVTIERALKKGGTLLISVPFVWRIHGYPSDYWRMTPAALDVVFPNIHWHDKKIASNNVFYEKTQNFKIDGKVGLERTEVLAFGVLK